VKKSAAIIQSAIIFALIGLAAAYLVITHLPVSPPDGRSTILMITIALGCPLVGAIVGLVVGIVAMIVGYFTEQPNDPDPADFDGTQPHPSK
jgi:uncharacterized membrane protein